MGANEAEDNGATSAVVDLGDSALVGSGCLGIVLPNPSAVRVLLREVFGPPRPLHDVVFAARGVDLSSPPRGQEDHEASNRDSTRARGRGDARKKEYALGNFACDFFRRPRLTNAPPLIRP